mmetsp:Transcript_118690/g.206683  ORF Transcript_118690/g.206683 Transcript_118690/m.206683 type:complete len:221 (-) Transcript_118690:296-958(-)
MPGRSSMFSGGSVGERTVTRSSRVQLTPRRAEFCSRMSASISWRTSRSDAMMRRGPTRVGRPGMDVSHTSSSGGSGISDRQIDTRMGSRVHILRSCGNSGSMHSRSRSVLFPLFSVPIVTSRGGSQSFRSSCSSPSSRSRPWKMRFRSPMHGTSPSMGGSGESVTGLVSSTCRSHCRISAFKAALSVRVLPMEARTVVGCPRTFGDCTGLGDTSGWPLCT